MKKSYRLEHLHCAACAEKMKRSIEKLEGVTACDISFLMQKLTLEAPEEMLPEILEKAAKICKKIEPKCRLIY